MKRKQPSLFGDSGTEHAFTSRLKTHGLDTHTVSLFHQLVCGFYDAHGRKLPWRGTADPYKILVSEIMLQQTQVDRVRGKYDQFIEVFPDFEALAHANFRELFIVWQGLGYNRRAIHLRDCALRINTDHEGRLPDDIRTLRALPGIGRYTAGALAAFAYGRPEVFIETNIRTVYIHYFFGDRTGVNDREIEPLVAQTLDREHPRRWYYALMDYGVYLKKAFGNPSRRSAHHARQTPFKGSNRQLRGRLLRAIVAEPASAYALGQALDADPERIRTNLEELEKEGFIKKTGNVYSSR